MEAVTLTRETVERTLEFISKTFKNTMSSYSNNLLTAVLPTIGWYLYEDKKERFAEVFIDYIPRDDKLKELLDPEDDIVWRFPVLKMRTDIEEKSDHFFSQFLGNFFRQMVWGINDLNMANIMAGKANFNWLERDKEPETMLSILVDKGWFGKGKGSKNIKTHWKE